MPDNSLRWRTEILLRSTKSKLEDAKGLLLNRNDIVYAGYARDTQGGYFTDASLRMLWCVLGRSRRLWRRDDDGHLSGGMKSI